MLKHIPTGLILGAAFLATNSAMAQDQALLFQTQSTEPQCQALADLRKEQTARELAGIVRACVDEGAHVNAIQTFWAYSNVALFDQQRVKDESAHVAVQELHGWVFSGYSFQTINALKEVIADLRDPESPFLAETCRGVFVAGPPEYRPDYMIWRGIVPRKHEEDWKVEDFDPDAAWRKALVEINGCPEAALE